MSFSRPALLPSLRALGLAFASALLLPLGASAVPIQAADGVAGTTPSRTSGPRRPGAIPQPSQASGLASQSSNGRGRPVPGQATPQTDEAMAEAPAVRIP